MGKLKNILKVALATIGSRILGLVRDSCSMAYMSIGAVSSAYTFAFSIPNLFRRLLGEGALSSAIVPIFSHSAKNKNLESAFDFLNKAVSRALVWTLLITLAGSAAAAACTVLIDPEQTRYFLGAKYSLVLLLYMPLICLAAVFTAVLNVLDTFGVPSATPILLNICIIAALFCGVAVFGKSDLPNIALSMCFGWLAGGALQAGVPAYCLAKKGWRFRFDLGKSDEIRELYALFLPALLGAAVVQLNIFISKLLAFNLNDSATPALYISSRILEFPLGVFGIAIATVYFPQLAKLAAQKRSDDFRREYDEGLTASMAITIPATFGIMALAREILDVLFRWGLFGVKDVDICLPVMLVSVAGLPFFAFTTYSTRGFHSNKDTKTPVKISYISIAVNLILSVALMFKFEAAGLAAANVAAAVFSAAALHIALKRRLATAPITKNIAKITAASAAMAAFCMAAKTLLGGVVDGKIFSLACCLILVPAGAAVYAGSLKILKFEKLDQLKKLVRARK